MRDDLLPRLPPGVQEYLLDFVGPYLRCEELRRCSRTLKLYCDGQVTPDTVRQIHSQYLQTQWGRGMHFLSMPINVLQGRSALGVGITRARSNPLCFMALRAQGVVRGRSWNYLGALQTLVFYDTSCSRGGPR